jgi:crossover junction endodeoxyribonuclease RuvC
MKVLGLDPGYGRLGWALVERKGSGFKAGAFGVFETPASDPFIARLAAVHEFTTRLCRLHAPAEAAVEQIFFSKNVKTALLVAQARGVLLVALQQAGVKVAEVSPQHVKVALTGHGAAGKPQVQAMVQRLLGLKEIPQPDDAADALGLAVAAILTRSRRDLEDRMKKVVP